MLISRWLDKGNAALNEFCIGRMNLGPEDRVLEIGFGSGRTVARMARTAAFVAGVDFSPEMVDSAKSLNRRAIAEGRVDIRNAAVSALPFDDAGFDKVYTANTIYFWPRPAQDAREIMRVIKPGGKLYIGFRPRHIMEKLPKQIIDDRFTPYSPTNSESYSRTPVFRRSKLKAARKTAPSILIARSLRVRPLRRSRSRGFARSFRLIDVSRVALRFRLVAQPHVVQGPREKIRHAHDPVAGDHVGAVSLRISSACSSASRRPISMAASVRWKSKKL